LKKELGQISSNTPVEPGDRLSDVWTSRAHTVIDLGDDLFTRGRPHPMIDHRLRNERLIKEAADSEVAVILLDVVLGYGSHSDPAAEIVPVVQKARDLAGKAGRDLVIVGFVCGTAGDPQNLSRQEAALREAGVLLAESNAQAVRMAAAVTVGAGTVGERS
jgi:FdrA protein